MKNKKAMIASLMLVGAVCVGSTLAYLTDKSNTLTNSFTVGQGYVKDPDLGQAVWVDEYDYDWKTTDAQTSKENRYISPIEREWRTLDGNNYGTKDNALQSGSYVRKDPKISLTADSVESYVYMQITYKTEENFKFVRAEQLYEDLEDAIDKDKWTIIANLTTTNDETNEKTVVVRYNTKFNCNDGEGEDININRTDALFDGIKIDDEFKGSTNISNIVIKACAVQAVYTENGTEVHLEPNDVNTDNPQADGPVFQ